MCCPRGRSPQKVSINHGQGIRSSNLERDVSELALAGAVALRYCSMDQGSRIRTHPASLRFFEDGSGGSFLVDLGRVVSVMKINSYSWHQHETLEEHRHRATQRFTLYGFSEDQLPNMRRSPRCAGLMCIARVNTDRFFQVDEPLERPAHQACSITAAHEEIGRFRYLLWVVHGGTFLANSTCLARHHPHPHAVLLIPDTQRDSRKESSMNNGQGIQILLRQALPLCGATYYII